MKELSPVYSSRERSTELSFAVTDNQMILFNYIGTACRSFYKSLTNNIGTTEFLTSYTCVCFTVTQSCTEDRILLFKYEIEFQCDNPL
jgi:hypothetical protein